MNYEPQLLRRNVLARAGDVNAELLKIQACFDEIALDLSGRVKVLELIGAGPVALSSSLHAGRSLEVSNGDSTAAIILTLPDDAPIGTVFLIDQVGVSPVRVSSARLRNRLMHNGAAGRWSGISAKCIRNEGGTAAEWVLSGDTAALA